MTGLQTTLVYSYCTRCEESTEMWKKAASECGREGVLAGKLDEAVRNEMINGITDIPEPALRALCLDSLRKADFRTASLMLWTMLGEDEEGQDEVQKEEPDDGPVRMLLVEPGKAPKEVLVERDHRAIQELVGGCFEAVYPWEDAALLCHDEGKILGLPVSRVVKGDPIAGPFLVAGVGTDDFESLTDEQVKKHSAMFALRR